MKRLIAASITAFAAMASASVASAQAVTDCPLRDAPFSVDTPLIDLMLSPAAMEVLRKAYPGKFDQLPPMFASTKAPTFTAILSLRQGAGFTGIDPSSLAALDPQLRAVPVTEADKTARCERYDNDRPTLTPTPGKPRLLLFEKITGFRDDPSVKAAHTAFVAMAKRKGWGIATTEKGGSINSETLKTYDAVIWNNVSGDVLTLSQRDALKSYLSNGGAFIAVHGSGGDPAYFWDWYADSLLGARFAGHPMDPQFQDARIVVEDRKHPIASKLPAEWVMNDEWYSFKSNPKAAGVHVILSLDESTYKPNSPRGGDLRMGDHPIAWTNCIGKGRAFYSAIGHRPETYSHPTYVTVLESAIEWATDPKSCPARK